MILSSEDEAVHGPVLPKVLQSRGRLRARPSVPRVLAAGKALGRLCRVRGYLHHILHFMDRLLGRGRVNLKSSCLIMFGHYYRRRLMKSTRKHLEGS